MKYTFLTLEVYKCRQLLIVISTREYYSDVGFRGVCDHYRKVK